MRGDGTGECPECGGIADHERGCSLGIHPPWPANEPNPLFFDEHGNFKSPELAALHAITVQHGYSTPAREARRMIRDGGRMAVMARAWLDERGLSLDGEEEPDPGFIPPGRPVDYRSPQGTYPEGAS